MFSAMLKMLKICLLALTLGFLSQAALANELVVEREIFEDATGQMDLAQIKGAAFSPVSKVISRGYSRSVFWLRFKVDVPAVQKALVFSIRPTLLDSASLFFSQSGSQSTELALNLNERSAQAQTLLSLQPGLQTLYLRVETTGLLLFYAQITTWKEAFEQTLASQMKLGSVLAAYAFLTIVMLGLMMLRREIFCFLFLIHLLVCLLHYLALFGFLGNFFAWNWVAGKTLPKFLGIVNFLSFGLFFQSIFDPLDMPRAQRWTRYALAIYALLMVFFFVLDQQQVLRVSTFLGTFATLLAMGAMLIWLLKLSLRTSVLKTHQVLIGLVFVLFSLVVIWTMLQLIGIIEPTQFLIESAALRGIFLPLGLLGFMWLRDKEKMIAIDNAKLAQAISDAHAGEQAQRLATQSQFMAMLMHELKTPLYIIQLAATSLSTRVDITSPDATRLNNINRSVDDLNFIIERCVQADQLEQSDLPVTISAVTLKTLLYEMRHIQGHERIAYSGIAQAKVSTDYQYARIILLNLITNALKYSPSDSVVLVDVQADECDGKPGLRLKISNTIGRAGRPDPLKVFNRYYRAEGAKKEVGAGLGLWLAHSIALKLGSQLRCISDDTMVHFYFSLELR